MTTIHEAIEQVDRIYTQGWEAQQQEFRTDPVAAGRALAEADQKQHLREYLEELSTHSSGAVSVTRLLARSIAACPICGESYNAGSVVVRHDDGREVRFDIGLFHYAKEGHLITDEDVDTDMLLTILEDA